MPLRPSIGDSFATYRTRVKVLAEAMGRKTVAVSTDLGFAKVAIYVSAEQATKADVPSSSPQIGSPLDTRTATVTT